MPAPAAATTTAATIPAAPAAATTTAATMPAAPAVATRQSASLSVPSAVAPPPSPVAAALDDSPLAAVHAALGRRAKAAAPPAAAEPIFGAPVALRVGTVLLLCLLAACWVALGFDDAGDPSPTSVEELASGPPTRRRLQETWWRRAMPYAAEYWHVNKTVCSVVVAASEDGPIVAGPVPCSDSSLAPFNLPGVNCTHVCTSSCSGWVPGSASWVPLGDAKHPHWWSKRDHCPVMVPPPLFAVAVLLGMCCLCMCCRRCCLIKPQRRHKAATATSSWRPSFLITELIPGTANMPRLIRGKCSRATYRDAQLAAREMAVLQEEDTRHTRLLAHEGTTGSADGALSNV